MKSSHMIGFAVAVLLACAAPSSGTESTAEPSPPKSNSDTVPLYTNLGSHQKRISTKVEATQQYFDQGLRLVYGFNHAEAIRSFTRAAELDPTCAMCYWGIALAYGPTRQRSDGLGERSRRVRGGAESAGAQVPRHGG